MKYEFAPDIQQVFVDIVKTIELCHIRLDSVMCFRSYGSSSRGTIARCHTLGKLMQKALGRKGFYVLEFLSERFDRFSEKDKIKTIIHELMHIPKCFGGGFKHHDYVCNRNIDLYYKRYIEKKANSFYVRNAGISEHPKNLTKDKIGFFDKGQNESNTSF